MHGAINCAQKINEHHTSYTVGPLECFFRAFHGDKVSTVPLVSAWGGGLDTARGTEDKEDIFYVDRYDVDRPPTHGTTKP